MVGVVIMNHSNDGGYGDDPYPPHYDHYNYHGDMTLAMMHYLMSK